VVSQPNSAPTRLGAERGTGSGVSAGRAGSTASDGTGATAAGATRVGAAGATGVGAAGRTRASAADRTGVATARSGASNHAVSASTSSTPCDASSATDGPLHGRIAAQHRLSHRSQLRLEPGDDRLPLGGVDLRLRLGQVEHGQPLLDAADVGLRLARTPMNGSFCARAQASRTSAERVRASRRMPTAATLQRPLATRGSAIISAKQSAADSRSKIELQTGIRMTSAKATTRARSKPRSPPGVSRTTCWTPGGGRRTRFGSTAQPTIGALRGRSRRLRERSHDCVDCWRIDVAQHHQNAGVREVRSEVGRERALAASPLAIDDGDDGHDGPVAADTPRSGPGQNVTGWPRLGKGTVVFSI
jgi:hypothetical protein